MLERLELQIPITLCKLEKIFPPAFFDVMVHLAVHLATEAKLGGPVQYRWMYPIERFLRKLKCYVRNKSRPEGSMAEGYIVEESLIFFWRYLHDIETKFNQLKRNSEGVHEDLYKGLSVFAHNGFPLNQDKSRSLTEQERKQAHIYMLKNCEEIQSFLCEYEQDNHNMDLDEWFHHRIMQLHKERDARVNEELLSLAYGPLYGIQTFKGYVINGFRFHTKELETKRLKQNSGVLVKGVMGDKMIDYYGVLNEIVELQYLVGKRTVLFKCDWWDVDNIGRGIKIDKHGFTSVNTTRKLATDEPFVLASQVEQVFYVEDGLTPNWLIVLKGHSESFMHLPKSNNENNGEVLIGGEAFQQDTQYTSEDFTSLFEEDEVVTNWDKDDIEACHDNITITSNVIEPIDSDPETDDEDLVL
ncbi:uncharacterized protein [Euphorbia lathyris]|uniref:uncharacterized protein n=1 Tax=Euphorbia lathyris TaxID=212925 RepID=UPI0033143101